MASKRKTWLAYRVSYDNGECRHYNNEYNALLYAGRMAKIMKRVNVSVNGELIASWEDHRIVYYAPHVPHSLI